MARLLQDWATQRAQEAPEAVAVVDGDARLSYAALEATSNQLANVLADVGVRAGDRVALLLPRSTRAIIGTHGVLKTGAAYVPVDVTSPVGRARMILESAEPTVLLAGKASSRLVTELQECSPVAATSRVGWLDDETDTSGKSAFTWSDVTSAADDRPSIERVAEGLAHILFTSGSTGTPKGVSITHANVTNFIDWVVPYLGLGPTDRTSGHHPLHFDLSTFDMYASFAAGAELHLVPPALNLLAPKLAAFIRDRALTQWFSVPSTLNYLAHFDALEDDDFPELRRVLWCGEVFPTRSLIHWMKRLPHVEFTNLYGPTEATIASSYYRVPECPEDESQPIPIGRPCGNESLHVLDDELAPVAAGQVGHLFIGGAGLSPGYWRDEEKTRDAFVVKECPDGPKRIYRTGDLAWIDAEGVLHYVGREDTQIKSRGYRIELGEIETAVNGLESVGECAVVAVDSGGFEGKMICCAYSTRPGHDETSTAELRRELARTIPRYMLPTRWLAMTVLPKNANGKIDRPALATLMTPGAGAPSRAGRAGSP